MMRIRRNSAGRTPVNAAAALALAGALALGACARGAPAVPAPARATLDRAQVDRIAALLSFEDARDFQPDSFRLFAADPSPEVRRRTALAAGRIGDFAARPLLFHLLADRDDHVRADAAFALGLLGDTASAVVTALDGAAPVQWAMVRESDVVVGEQILGALGKIGTDEARESVLRALRELYPAQDPRSRATAGAGLLAIWRFRSGAGRVVGVAPYLDNLDPAVRWRAAYALMRLATPDAAARLLPLAGDPEHRVREFVARGLAVALVDSAGVADSARAVLGRLLDDPNPHVRINALRTLAGYPQPPLDAMAARLRDSDANVAVAAADAVGAVGAAGKPALDSLLRSPGAHLAARAAAARHVAGSQPDVVLPVLDAWSTGDFRERYAAARALADLGWTHGSGLLRRLAVDPDPRVAVAAIEAAGELAIDSALVGPDAAALRDLLLERVRAPEPRIAAVALRAIRPLLRPGDLAVVLAAYGTATARTDSAGVLTPDAREDAIAAVSALAALQAEGADAAAAFRSRFPQPTDRWVARAVARAFGGQAPPAVVATDPAFYRDVVRRYVLPVLAGKSRPRAVIRTAPGDITIELLSDIAPLTVNNFVRLAVDGFFDRGVWHRVVPNFVLQDGAPAGDADGGPGWEIRDEINPVPYLRGTLGMALSGPDTGGSQWFITVSPQPHLDGGYTVFGRVVGGMGNADRVVQGDPIASVRVRW